MGVNGESANVKLKAKERFSFALGDLAYQCVFYWVSAYLMIFYTDVFLIPASAVSVLMLIVRIYDAVNDPIIGSAADRTHTRFGRYRPWIVVGGIGLCISALLMFWAHPDWNSNAKIVYMYVTYILVVTFSTMFYMAYMALTGCISTNAEERTKTSSWRMIASYAGMLAVGYAAPYMIEVLGYGNAVEGYLKSVLIFNVISIPLFLICAVGAKERVTGQVTVKQEKIPVKAQFVALWKNKQMLILLICMTAHGIQMNGRMTIATYYCTYVGNGAEMLAFFNLLNSVACIGGCLLAPKIFAWIGHKGKISTVVLFICAAAMAFQYIVEAPSAAFYILTVIIGICYGCFSSMMFSMIPDAVDLTHQEQKIRLDGFFNAIASFGFKIGGALGTAVIGFALSKSGYVANQVQSVQCLNVIRALMSFLPGIFCLLAAVFLLCYKIDRKKHGEILEDLKATDTLV